MPSPFGIRRSISAAVVIGYLAPPCCTGWSFGNPPSAPASDAFRTPQAATRPPTRRLGARTRSRSRVVLFDKAREWVLSGATRDGTRELPPLVLYNSLTRNKDPFVPLSESAVSMYTCGPTVYDHAHVGNFRAFLTYDVLKRALLYFGYDVAHVCNLTDVDDKIIVRADREKISVMELTRRFERLFMDDLDALNVLRRETRYPRATEHIPEMVRMIQDLEAAGLAYESNGSWYFRVGEKKGYGNRLVKLEVKAEAGAMPGLDDDEYDIEKDGARDFALWKAYKPGVDREDATWDTDIGRGRPGWHIECSAMAKKYLGESIDLHCGGIDLKFPHHENEIAQSEGANNEKPFSAFWLHNGFVNIGDEKMSKSKGNFLTLRTACPKALDVRAYRYLIVSSQYRTPLSFTTAAMDAARAAIRRMDGARANLERALSQGGDPPPDGGDGSISGAVGKALENFEKAVADDLSMPRAAASLFEVIKLAEGEFKRVKKEKGEGEPLDMAGLRAVYDAMETMNQIFGIFYEVPVSEGAEEEEEADEGGEVPEEVQELVISRTAAKTAKDWALADSYRDRLLELGFSVKDVKGGDPIISRV
mmetsp:Transcript_20148/g.45654  ORF Transcript_20148/g.45654 Transcript_20148/m.45654 type:complete len:591 (-) Transcript_20148:772-2544(-)